LKALICSLIILCSVILSTVLAASYTDVILSDFEEAIDARITHSPSESLLGIEAIGEEYSRIKPFLIFFMRENNIQEMEMYMEDIKSAAAEDDVAAITEAKNRLMLHIQQLRRLSAFSMEAIF
jgi:hypothetical protein